MNLMFRQGVYQCVKDTIWKQITTSCKLLTKKLMVFISVSKIQFESKSQHLCTGVDSCYRCLSVCQRYNLKANHNGVQYYKFNNKGVYQCVKDTIWKQITTFTTVDIYANLVFISVSKIQFESKSQHVQSD